MKEKIILLCLVLPLLLSVKLYPVIDFQLSPGIDIYRETFGCNVNVNIYFPQHLFNKSRPDINTGIKLLTGFAGFNDVSFMNFGGGFDFGYIISIGNFNIIPSFCTGYTIGNISYSNTKAADFNNLLFLPHLILEYSLSKNFSAGIDSGYKINLLNSSYDYIPNILKGISVNLTLSYVDFDLFQQNKDTNKENDPAVDSNKSPANTTSDAVISQTNSEDRILRDVKALVSAGNKEKAIKLLESELKKNPANSNLRETLSILKSSNIKLLKDF